MVCHNRYNSLFIAHKRYATFKCRIHELKKTAVLRPHRVKFRLGKKNRYYSYSVTLSLRNN